MFPADQIVTPDVVRGAHETLREAIEQDGWPTLGQSRGKVLFCLDNEGSYRDNYLAGHAGLRGRVLFTSSEPPADEAGFIKLNDPLGDFDHIKDVVAQGFIVRTRADADTLEARSGNVAPRDAAIASGAQFVSTDYPVPNPDFGTGYMVAIPVARRRAAIRSAHPRRARQRISRIRRIWLIADWPWGRGRRERA